MKAKSKKENYNNVIYAQNQRVMLNKQMGWGVNLRRAGVSIRINGGALSVNTTT